MFRTALPASIAAASLLVTSPARAAGGHHAVDDAAILDPGQCQLETWFDRTQGGNANLLHAGPACRMGPTELGLNLDSPRAAGDGRTNASGLQAKWAWPLSDSAHVAAVVSTAWQDKAPRHPGSTLLVPLTWQVTDALQFHVNAGRDFLRDAPDAARGGVALEWLAMPAWSFVAERFRESQADRWRLGARRMLGNASVDLSRAQGLDGAASSWTLGLTWLFSR